MGRLLATLLLIGFLATSIVSQRQQFVIYSLGKGQAYLELSEPQKRAYAMGTINGMAVWRLMDAPQEKMSWFDACIQGMNSEQVAAILTKYIKERPNEWHHQLSILTFQAMQDACDQKPTVKN